MQFMNILIEQTIIPIITEQIYAHKKLVAICSKLIFQKIIEKTCNRMYF